MISILAPVFLLSLVLLGIHAYFGLEVIRRGIIFTDLAIGQMSALGAAVALLVFNGRFLYPVSLCFALLAAFLIAIASKRVANLEAFIGILYAFGLSGVFIVLSRSPHGMEEFQTLLAADILFTPVKEIAKIAVAYSLLGSFLALFYRRLSGLAKDLLFFSAFAATVTSSVQLAGVLVVFAILVGPASISLRLKAKRPIIAAWGIGMLINLAAISVSYQFDLPTGYALVFAHALVTMAVNFFKIREVKVHG